MENRDPSRDQGGRPGQQPGKDDQGDVGSDPRRTREGEDRDNERQPQSPRRDQRPDQTTPKTA